MTVIAFCPAASIDMGLEFEGGGDARALLLKVVRPEEQYVRQIRKNHSAAFEAKVAVAVLKGDRKVGDLASEFDGQARPDFAVALAAKA